MLTTRNPDGRPSATVQMRLFVAVAAIALVAGPGVMAAYASRGADAVETLTLTLVPSKKIGQKGTITIVDRGDTFDVIVKVTPPKRYPGIAQYAHLHKVACADYAALKGYDAELGSIVDSLTDLYKGRSRTTIRKRFADLRGGGYSFNVHEQSPPYRPTGCVDVPLAVEPAPSP